MNIFAKGDMLVVVIDLPGIRQRVVRVAPDRNVLVVEGETHPGSGDGARQCYRVERQRGGFRRLLHCSSRCAPRRSRRVLTTAC
jgi:HSP20 family molecular chaperone IbpA